MGGQDEFQLCNCGVFCFAKHPGQFLTRVEKTLQLSPLSLHHCGFFYTAQKLHIGENDEVHSGLSVASIELDLSKMRNLHSHRVGSK